MKYDSNGMRTQKGNIHYYYASTNNLIALVNGNKTLFFYYDENGSPVSFSFNGIGMYYYVKNLQGDIVKIVNKDGNVVASYEYDAWGRILSIKDFHGAKVTDSNHIGLLNPFRYRGYVYDDETGLYYLQSRYYDPKTRRFLNADLYCDTVSGSPLSTNMFAYCENSFLMKSDVNGKNAWWIESPKSASGFGHASVLIRQKDGYWWYGYWGGTSIQFLFLGTTKLKEIDKKVSKILLKYKEKYNLKISHTDQYKKALKFYGNFSNAYNYIIKLMRDYSYQYSARIYPLRFNPDSNKSDLNHKEHRLYKNKTRPNSWLIFGNKKYDLKKNNCLDFTVTVLTKGNVNKDNNNFQWTLRDIKSFDIPPNKGYDRMKRCYKYYEKGVLQ